MWSGASCSPFAAFARSCSLRIVVACSGKNRATGERRPLVRKHTTHVALDDRKRKIVAGILPHGVHSP
jgi:hypothetical protein